MRYSAETFAFEPATDHRITDAVIAENRISVDWSDADGMAGFVSQSDDGTLYRGSYSYRQDANHSGRVEFRVYRADDGEVLLFGRWWKADSPVPSNWLLRLTPVG